MSEETNQPAAQNLPVGLRRQAEQVKQTLPEHFIQKNPLTDSAGISWQGRDYHESHFPNDTGEVIPQVAQAIAQVDAGADPLLENLVLHLAQTRVLIPIQAIAIETATTEHGLKADNASEMAMVKLQLSSTEIALPIFSSAAALSKWNPKARPVPMPIEQAAQSAVVEGCTTLLLDLNRQQPLKLSRSALWALAQGKKWYHPANNDQVKAEFNQILQNSSQIEKIALRPGSSQELDVHLKLVPGLDSARIKTIVESFNQQLAHSQIVADQVSSISLKLHG